MVVVRSFTTAKPHLVNGTALMCLFLKYMVTLMSSHKTRWTSWSAVGIKKTLITDSAWNYFIVYPYWNLPNTIFFLLWRSWISAEGDFQPEFHPDEFKFWSLYPD